jgi:methylated-DNA-protein-cysteine methyltransferase related protein
VTARVASPQDARSRLILARVRAIPEGYVSTYGDIDRRAPRLVGQVLAATVEHAPWHRVVRADGSVALGEEQLRRLRNERVPMKGDRVDLRAARWPGMEHLLPAVLLNSPEPDGDDAI